MSERRHIPGVVQISLTHRCQCSCRHCGVSFLKKRFPAEPSLSDLEAIFADLRRAGTEAVDLFGGEPTLRRDLAEVIALARSYGFMTLVETNGFRLDQDYVRELVSAGLDHIFISLDHFEADYHDRNRGLPGLFERAVRAIGLCRDHGLPVHVSFVPRDEAYFRDGDVNRFVSFVFEKGATHVRILLPRFTGNMQLLDSSPFADGRDQELVQYIDPQHYERIYFHSPDTPLGDVSVCSAKQYFCHIMANGNVLPCPYLPLVFGNIREESIATIFDRIQNSEIMRRSGPHCLARNLAFVRDFLSAVTPDEPYIRMPR